MTPDDFLKQQRSADEQRIARKRWLLVWIFLFVLFTGDLVATIITGTCGILDILLPLTFLLSTAFSVLKSFIEDEK